MGEVLWYDVVCGKSQFTFMPPVDWRLETRLAARSFTFHTRGYDAHVEVKFAGANRALTPKIDLPALRAQILERFPRATLREDFDCFTGIGRGRAFDLDWKVAQDTPIAVRMVLVPFPGGTVEFCLTTSPAKFAETQQVLGAILTSLSKPATLEKEYSSRQRTARSAKL